ncbi:MAG TPA: pilus assembly protein, partial [Anaerolineaceae bacterium]|nr:pilus assembly protein [Anaerolineaceae bacterium]
MKRLRIGANYVRWQIKSLRGQGMVEFALALPVFLLLVLGIMEFSWMLFHYSITFSASREAARYGSSVGLGATNLSRDIDCVGIRAEAFRVGRPAGITTNNQVEIRYDEGPDDTRTWTSLPSCDDPTKPNTQLGWRIAVRVTANHNSLIGIFPSFPITSTTFRTIIKNVDMTANPTAPAGQHTNTPTYTVSPTVTPTPTETLTPTSTFTPLPQADITVSKNDGTSFYIPGGTV